MKKIFLMFVLLFTIFPINAAELFYSDGTSISVEKAEGFSAIKSNALSFASPENELYRFDLGKSFISIVSGNSGRLPVYFLGETPNVAEMTVFWRGEKSVDYMESKYEMKLVEILPTYPLYVFSVKGDSVEISEKIVKNGDGYAFPDLVREAALKMIPESVPQDSYFDKQWHLRNTGTIENYLGKNIATMKNADIRFVRMLAFLNSNNIEVDTETKIAIMDTGVANHTDLNISKPGYTASSYDDTSENAGEPDLSLLNEDNLSYMAHGTECAGLSAGAGNETGMSGVCPWCRIYPVNITSPNQEGMALTGKIYLKIYEKYVADPDIAAINCSFGPRYSGGIDYVRPDEIEAIKSFMRNGRGGKGGAVVYSAGNENIDSSHIQLLGYDFVFERNGIPVTDRVVTVNATTAWDTRAEYSNFGPSSTVSAPSRSLRPQLGMATTTIPGYGDYATDYTLKFGGTSSAAPEVSGLFGVIFSVNPALTLEEAMGILRQSADKINPETGFWDESGFSVKYGYGRINLEKAVRLAAGFPICEEEQEEFCGNNIDDDCDGYVDEGCSGELEAGKPCEETADCISGSLTTADVICVKEHLPWIFKGGYCFRKSTAVATCPDGTKFLYESKMSDFCALECNSTHPCGRDGYYCSDEVLGVCLPFSPVGGPCESGMGCEGENSVCRYFQIGFGYCTQSCLYNDDSYCPDGAKCVTYGKNLETSCLASCDSDEDCRTAEGYICHPQIGSKSGVCYIKCGKTSDCNDDSAVCTAEGYCAPENWTGWSEEEPEDTPEEDFVEAYSDDKDEDEFVSGDEVVEADDNGSEEYPDAEIDDDSYGCSLLMI